MTRRINLIPLPLRLALGVGLMIHGGIKLFIPGGHANIVYLLTQLGVPFAEIMGWVVGVVEFGGGLGMVLGWYFTLATLSNALNVVGLLAFAALTDGIPQPLAGGDPLPELREAVLILAAAITLWLTGPGQYAIDADDRVAKNS